MIKTQKRMLNPNMKMTPRMKNKGNPRIKEDLENEDARMGEVIVQKFFTYSSLFFPLLYFL